MPNDIYYRGKKVGGILTESVSKAEKVQKIYIGIGLNVNQEDFPKDLIGMATSLKIEFGKNFDREEIFFANYNWVKAQMTSQYFCLHQ